MRVRGNLLGASKTLEGDLSLSFVVDDISKEELESLKDEELVLEISKYKKNRSLNANAYFWQLCDKIAKKLGSDKETIYLMKLKDAGVFEQIEVIEDGIPLLEPLFRMIDIDYKYTAYFERIDGEIEPVPMCSLHCYHGSHEYDTKQMSDLIESTVADAKALGIETMTSDELEHLCSVWKAR